MNIKQHYCIVTQEEANEARELLVKAGEPIWEDEDSFNVNEEYNALSYYEGNILIGWIVWDCIQITRNPTQLTYPQFKEMLNEKINKNGNTI